MLTPIKNAPTGKNAPFTGIKPPTFNKPPIKLPPAPMLNKPVASTETKQTLTEKMAIQEKLKANLANSKIKLPVAPIKEVTPIVAPIVEADTKSKEPEDIVIKPPLISTAPIEESPVEEKKDKPEDKKPEVKQRKRRSKPVEETSTKETEETRVINKAYSFEKIDSQAIFVTFVDEDWESTKVDLLKANAGIVISRETNPNDVRAAIADLVKIKDAVLGEYNHYKTNFQHLTSDKPEGFIERFKRTHSQGTNEDERKKSGIIACKTYKTVIDNEEVVIDLYEYLEETRERYNFYKDLVEQIDFKARVLNTMIGAIKTEASLTY